MLAPVQSVVGYTSKVFGRADMYKKMAIETVVMINLFPLPGYSQYLALRWVELHLPFFSEMASLSRSY